MLFPLPTLNLKLYLIQVLFLYFFYFDSLKWGHKEFFSMNRRKKTVSVNTEEVWVASCFISAVLGNTAMASGSHRRNISEVLSGDTALPSIATHTWTLLWKVECTFEQTPPYHMALLSFSSVTDDRNHTTPPVTRPPLPQHSPHLNFSFPSIDTKSWRQIYSLKVAKGPFGSRKTVITNASCSLRSQETEGKQGVPWGHIFCFLNFGFQNMI